MLDLGGRLGEPGREPLEPVHEALLLLARRQERRQGRDRAARRLRHYGRDPARQPVRFVGVVAAEQLVAPVARQRHRDVGAGKLRHQKGGEERDVGEGLVEVDDQAVEQLDDVGDDLPLAVSGGEALRDPAGVRQLVVAPVREAHAEGVDRRSVALGGLGHERHDGARVDAAREEGPQRHVRHHLAGDGAAERLAQRRRRLLVAPGRPRGGRGLPVAGHGELAVPVDQVVGGGQAPDGGEDRARRDDVLVGQELVEGLQIDLPRHVGSDEQGLDLGGEKQAARRAGVVERLLSRPVPGRHQRARSRVPKRQGEHAVEALDEGRAPLLVGVHRDLDVAGAREGVSGRDELGAKHPVVVDLAVAHQVDGAVLARERLPAPCYVDDREAAHAESGAGKRHLAGVVGPAVPQRPDHGREVRGENRLLRIPVGDAGDTAH